MEQIRVFFGFYTFGVLLFYLSKKKKKKLCETSVGSALFVETDSSENIAFLVK